ncbi:hypothetical protein FHW69_002029 [Luteibacter sp. Sphag1AF]|uniref:DUF1684 domain-containing protein n=1 Tax=Luteibacter sp. Sphag1AF TaxID=2587031 RepID=UPI00161D24E0|nr:DUF1684 domain-containing protein [Luteibacter sp. Sphag1AF]MBB3227406.1 hypothetical protein [Luteibacter sp. Sphag1AF]
MIRNIAIASVLAMAATSVVGGDAGYVQSIEKYRAQRLETLTGPSGWLTLIGLEWLKPGANSIGTAADNDIVLKAGPAHLGVITLHADGSSEIVFADHAEAAVDGKIVPRATLVDDAAANASPSQVTFGTASFYVIVRDGRRALRVKDSAAPTRTGFQGLDYFDIDPSWRVVADWVPFDTPHFLEIGSVLGTVDKERVPGKAVFERNGHRFELFPIQEDATSLFFVIADRTSGKETYGAARFLTTTMPVDGKLVLDFNKATNPPCAFTPYATCPLAPPENRLDVRVTAGELKYKGSHH